MKKVADFWLENGPRIFSSALKVGFRVTLKKGILSEKLIVKNHGKTSVI
jgi:hypothetical protein